MRGLKGSVLVWLLRYLGFFGGCIAGADWGVGVVSLVDWGGLVGCVSVVDGSKFPE